MWILIRNLLLAGMVVYWATPAFCEYYQYTDQNGVLRFTDNLASIPPDQRPQPDDQGRVTIGLQPESTLTIVARRDSELGAQADSAYVGYTSADGFDHMYHSRPLDADGRLTLGSLSASL